jgi:hypothetical protein
MFKKVGGEVGETAYHMSKLPDYSSTTFLHIFLPLSKNVQHLQQSQTLFSLGPDSRSIKSGVP